MTRPDGTDGRPWQAGDTSLPVTNPPGLSEIAYQVSDFTGFRRALLTPLPGEQQLTGWSPGPGDLGLQVLEWWAYLADILTFYNERIANNSYLRTAAGPQGPPVRNVAGLVRLLGYLGRPGTTAQGVLAAIRSPGAPEEDLIVPAGLPITSTPAAGVPAQVFETGGSVRFRGPSDVPIGLPPDDNLFQPADTTPGDAGQPKSVLLAGRATVQPGDQLVLVKQAWDGCTTDWALTTVRAATTETGPSGPPNTRVVLDSNDWTGITSTEPQAADYRALKATATALLWTMPAPQARPGLGARAAAAQAPGTPQTPGQTAAVPLATLVRGVAPGDDVLFTGLPTPPAQMLAYVTGYAEDIVAVQPASTDNPPALVPRTTLEVRAVDASRLASAIANPDEVGNIAMWYGLREAATLIPTPAAALAQLGLTVTVPAGLTLPADGAVALQDATGAGLLVTASRPSPDTVQLSAIDSDPASVNPPLYAPITLLTDLVQVSGGTTVPAEVLGNGDATAASQAFTLQQSPLVYLPAGQPGGPPDSTLNVTVDGVPWSQKPSFYRQPPDATVYVVRSLADGSTQVCFGDGINGARLPTGVGNVVASYRYGPAGPPPPPGRLSTVLQPQPNLATMRNPVALTPGTEPEAAAQTAGNAPSSAVLLGAVISPTDCEEAAATVAGVTRVKAYWAWDEGRRCPGITLCVDGDGTVAAVQAQLPVATSRMPIAVKAAQAAGLAITGQLIAGAGADQQAIKKAADAALTDPDSGLFSPGRMGIGQRLYRSQVEAALTVSGVSTVVGLQITRTTSSGSGDRPDAARPDAARPDAPRPDAPSLDPGPDGYFRLLAEALTICVVGHG
jgi:hypothetical protein